MKTSIIPAQITTVEDRIAANLSFIQLVLLAAPLFFTALINFTLPPFGKYSLYKLIVSLLTTMCSSILAIRLHDKILLDLIKLRLTYFLRPNLYVYKSGLINKQDYDPATTIYRKKQSPGFKYEVVLADSAKTNSRRLLLDRQFRVAFESKSGGLNVKVSSN